MKTVYEEALQDMKKLREVAEANARNTIIDSLAPKLKDLIEKNLSESMLSEEDIDEGDFAAASGIASHPEMTGATSGSDNEEKSDDESSTTESFEVKEESYEALQHLSSLAGPALSDRIVAEVYKTYDHVNEFVTGTRQMNLDELNNTIHKIEDIYFYLQENSVDNKVKLEEKLETCYGLLNSFRESKMNMKDFVSEKKNRNSLAEEKEVTLRVTGLPDDVELENLNIDIISDEEPSDETPGEEVDMEASGEDMSAGAPPAPEAAMGESVDEDEDEEVLSDDTMVEVSIPMLRRVLANLKEAKKKNSSDASVLSNFGGGKKKGDPLLDSDLENLGESEEEMEEGECMDELQQRRRRDEKGEDQSDKHLRPESITRMLKLASEDLKESKAWYLKQVGTSKEAGARKIVERAAKRFERVKELADKRGNTVARMDESVSMNKAVKSALTESQKENDGLRKQLAEVNLLNSKLIYANKLLQREGLTKNQKVTVIDKLDEAASLREVKLIYESLVKAFEGDGQGTIRENASRRPVSSGSSSRATSSSDRSVISEGMETARWLELAGLSTK